MISMLATLDRHTVDVQENPYSNAELANRIHVDKLAAVVKDMTESDGFKNKYDVSISCFIVLRTWRNSQYV